MELFDMQSLTANDLKTRGITAIEESLAKQPEVVISVRGKERFVVMDLAHYHHLRECELDAALAQTMQDMAAGHYVIETAQQHMVRMESLLAADASGKKKTVLSKTARRSKGG